MNFLRFLCDGIRSQQSYYILVYVTWSVFEF